MSLKPSPVKSRVQQIREGIVAAFGIILQYPALLPLALITLADEINYSGINNIALPAYIRTLNLPDDGKIISALTIVFLVSEAIFRAPTGWLSDRYGRTRLVTLAMLLAAPSFLLGALVQDYRWLFILRAWDGLVAAMLFTTIYAIIGDTVPERCRANAMGVINMMYMVGVFIGYALAGGLDFATDKLQPRIFLFFSAGMVLLLAVVAYLYYRKRPDEHALHPESAQEDADRIAIPRAQHVVLLLITFLQSFALTAVAPFIYRYATDAVAKGGLGFNLYQLAFLAGVPVIGVAIFALPLSRLADHIGKVITVRIAFICVAIALWVFSQTTSHSVLVAVVLILAVAFSMGVPAWLAILSSLSGSESRGATMGGYGAIQSTAAVAALVIAAQIWDHFPLHHGYIFVASAAAIAIAAVLAWLLPSSARPRSINGCSTV